MKIMEIIPQLHMGGAEHFTVNLCNELIRKGHDVILVVTNSVKIYGHFAKYLDNKVKLISMDKKKGADPALFFRLPRLIAHYKPDIVHTHLGAIVYGVFAPYLYPHAKYFHTIHNTADKEALTGGNFTAKVRRWLFSRNKYKAITISDESQRSFNEFYGNNVESITIFNGCPDEHFDKNKATEINKHKSKGEIIITNVARIMLQKNQIELVKAIESLNNKGYKVHLFIIGPNDTPEGKQISLISPKYTTMLGPKENPRDYMAASDAFILSSIYEGMPLTLIESFAVGTIPIVTPVGGMLNMVRDSYNGLITKGTTDKDIELTIERFLLMNDDQKKRISTNARLSYDLYSMNRCADKYINAFKN